MTDQPSKLFLGYLLLTVVLSGALVMVIEVLGSRVIGPFFGVSLFVWTSLIAVTLSALALGYAVGGWLADRWPGPSVLYGILIAAGIFALMVPILKAPVLQMCQPMGLRMGAFMATTLLFGPSLFLLGCVSPYTVRIATRELARVGRTVGGLYALSTIGSVIGTTVTGFFLIEWFGINKLFMLAGGALIGLGVIYFVVFRKRWQALAALILIPLTPLPDPILSRTLDDGTQMTRIENSDGYYGNIKIVEFSAGSVATREMFIDGLVQGGIDLRNGLSIYEYVYHMAHLPYWANPDGERALAIGLGGGLAMKAYVDRRIITDVVDIDPRVAHYAKKYFDFRTHGDIIIADGRQYLASTDRHYDYILLDVFNGDTTPGQFLSLEAMRLVNDRLSPGGILALNYIGSLKKDPLLTASLIKTMRQVFETIRIIPMYDPSNGEGVGNILIMARNGELLPPTALQRRSVPYSRIAGNIPEMLNWSVEAPTHPDAFILTDNYNPIDVGDAWLRESVRRELLKNVNWDILLNTSS